MYSRLHNIVQHMQNVSQQFFIETNCFWTGIASHDLQHSVTVNKPKRLYIQNYSFAAAAAAFQF